MANLLDLQHAQKIYEEARRRQIARNSVIEKDATKIKNRAKGLVIHTVPPKKEERVEVAGKGKGVYFEKTKEEEKAEKDQYLMEQALARTAKEIENNEKLLIKLLEKDEAEIDRLAWEQIYEERAEAEKLAKNKSQKKISKNIRDMEDKKKFMDYLKKSGKYSGKQLGPMKMGNLVRLYEKERELEKKMIEEAKLIKEQRMKEYEEKSERVRQLLEQKVKAKWDEKKRKEKKRKIEVDVSEKKKRKSSEQTMEASKEELDQAAEMKFEEMINLIEQKKERSTEITIQEEIMKVQPLAVHIPIIDWFTTKVDGWEVYKLLRVDGSFEVYRNSIKMFRSISREDVEDLYNISKKKYANYKERRFDFTAVLTEQLLMMYEPEGFSERIKLFENVRSWELNAKSGTYAVNFTQRMDFYLVEKEYEHNVQVMLQMLKRRLISHIKSDQAQQLLWKITQQIVKFRDQLFEDMKKFYKERDA